MARKRTSPAAYFLISIVVIIVVVIAGGAWLSSNEMAAMRIAFVPEGKFEAEKTPAAPEYANGKYWAMHPAINGTMVATMPEGEVANDTDTGFDIFFVHPTTYLNRDNWNSPIGEEESQKQLQALVVNHQANAFDQAGRIYMPQYRQATFGSFLAEDTDSALKAIYTAYVDVQTAFDYYINNLNEGRPFILAGHSQGALHSLYLLKNKISGTDIAKRMVAAYIIGWPVSHEGDLAVLSDIDACKDERDTGCVVSYQTFGDGGDPTEVIKFYDTSLGLDGKVRAGTKMLCTNPLDWAVDGAGDKNVNAGSLNVAVGISEPGTLVPALTGARCGPDGILYLTDQPNMMWQQVKMAGENYHVYDISMFWKNIQANAVKRTNAWKKLHIPHRMEAEG